MILPNEEAYLDEILKWNDADEAVKLIIQKYACKSADNARELLTLIPQVADAAMQKIGDIAIKNAEAAYWLMCQRKMKPDKAGMFFASMLPVCMAMFPTGNAEGGCVAEKEYFDLFKQQLSDPKIFSWEKDGQWAESHGYAEYLKLVEKQMKEEKQ